MRLKVVLSEVWLGSGSKLAVPLAIGGNRSLFKKGNRQIRIERGETVDIRTETWSGTVELAKQ